MQKSKEREYPIPFHNDVFFKYMLIGEDAGSAMLRSRIIEEIYGLKVQKTQVLNPELLPEAFFGKRAVLDVVLEDETGHLYDLEMQVSGYTKEEQLRFQQYGYRLVGRQLKQGDDYTKLKPFYQIIFMNDKPKDGGRMIRHYKVKDEDNQEEPNGTLNRAIVFLPMIKQRVKEVGGVENLTEFETFCYVLAYNPDDAILNMKRRMVNVVMEKYNEMREDGSLFSWAESVEFAEQAVQASKETAIRQHPIIFPILRIAVSSLNESKEQGKCNDSHHQQCPKNADRCGCDIDNATAFLAPHTYH